MTVQQSLNTATAQTPLFSFPDHGFQPQDTDAAVVFFAVCSERAQDTLNAIRSALSPGSLLYTRRGGAWRPLEFLTDGRGMLSARQTAILEHLASNRSNKEIGRAMGISHFTVRNHISQLMRLFNVATRSALAAVWATRSRVDAR
ncbi:response regulator transcription factor [Caulobacter sp.]|uniref:response regulator transcription factor n=2 Tax=Caulobacter sp. TaxID=78 RepID=UPI003D0F9FF0